MKLLIVETGQDFCYTIGGERLLRRLFPVIEGLNGDMRRKIVNRVVLRLMHLHAVASGRR
jgi:hypothetical protein